MLMSAEAVGQRRYVRGQTRHRPVLSLGIGPTILQGLRDIGYRDTAAAIAALIDNAIDAQANQVDIVLDAPAGQVRAIAVIDNGLGMVPEMMRAACAVGATCSFGDGPHLARSGFGLPSAPFSVGRRFHLLSAPTGSPLHGLTVDLDDLADADVHIPEATRAGIPEFVSSFLARERRGWSAGTIVLLDVLDRLATTSARTLGEQLRFRLGYVFGRFAARVALSLDGLAIRASDPLFLERVPMSSSTNDAEAPLRGEDKGVVITSIGGGKVAIRTALLPAALSTSSRGASISPAAAERQAIVRDMSGLVVSRLGRRLTVLPTTPIFHFGTADRPVRAELDFTPDLDDLFAPALSLQQVQVNPIVWEALRTAGAARIFDEPERFVVALALLVLDDAALVIELFLRHRAEQMAHAVGFEIERQLERAGRHCLIIVGAIVPSRAVHARRADLLHRLEEIMVGILRAVEHEMLEEMREAGLAPRLLLGADVVPDGHCHHRRLAVGMDEHPQAIR